MPSKTAPKSSNFSNTQFFSGRGGKLSHVGTKTCPLTQPIQTLSSPIADVNAPHPDATQETPRLQKAPQHRPPHAYISVLVPRGMFECLSSSRANEDVRGEGGAAARLPFKCCFPYPAAPQMGAAVIAPARGIAQGNCAALFKLITPATAVNISPSVAVNAHI